VAGRPGSGRPDRIRLRRKLRVAFRVVDHPVDAILPPLTDAGDSVVGDAAVLDGGPMEGRP
jgi:hypothetical protein